MNKHDELQQLTLWTKEVLDALEVPPGSRPDPQDELGLECQPAQQEGQLVYIQLPFLDVNLKWGKSWTIPDIISHALLRRSTVMPLQRMSVWQGVSLSIVAICFVETNITTMARFLLTGATGRKPAISRVFPA